MTGGYSSPGRTPGDAKSGSHIKNAWQKIWIVSLKLHWNCRLAAEGAHRKENLTGDGCGKSTWNGEPQTPRGGMTELDIGYYTARPDHMNYELLVRSEICRCASSSERDSTSAKRPKRSGGLDSLAWSSVIAMASLATVDCSNTVCTGISIPRSLKIKFRN